MSVKVEQCSTMENGSQTEPLTDIHDRVAEAYYGKMGQQFMRETQSRIHWICRHIQGKSVLDVGCSQGVLPILLAREGLKVVGVDISPRAIDEAKVYLANEPELVQANVSFINADFLSYHCEKFQTDTVVMSEVLEHLARPECFLESAARLLPERGRLIVTVPFGINDFIDHKHTFYLLEPLRLVGKHFDVVVVEVLGKWLGIVADRRAETDSERDTSLLTVALVEKLEAAFFKNERELREKCSSVRKKLDDTKQKYRGATDQVSALKQRVTKKESALQAAEQALRQATKCTETLEKRIVQLESERDGIDAKRRSHRDAFQTLLERHTKQGQEVDDLRAQRAVLDGVRRSLTDQVRLQGEEIQCLNQRHSTQAQEVGQLEVQRDALESERSVLRDRLRFQGEELRLEREALKALNEQYSQQSREAEQLSVLRKKEAERYATSSADLSGQLSALQQDLIRYRSALVEAEKRTDAAKQTISFRVGYALTHSTKSWNGLFKLPGTLLEIRRESKNRRKGKAAQGRLLEDQEPCSNWLTEVEAVFAQEGLGAAEGLTRIRGSQPTELATGLTRLAKLEFRSNANEALRLARESFLLDPRPFRRKWLAFLLFDAGHITEAHELLLSLPQDEKLKRSERSKAEFIGGCYRLLIGALKMPASLPAPVFQPASKRVLYVASSSLPYHITGYTARTHGILHAMRAHGWDVICVTRPGYPDDRPDACDITTETSRVVDGIRYEILAGPHRRQTPLDRYLFEAAEIIATKAREAHPALIHAASNYEAAIPALIAARKLGIPFVYEVRGLWEYTADSKIPGWEETERFALDRRLETLAATGADRVFTLTQALADELQARGVDADKIELAPNAIDPHAFTPIQRDASLAASLGLGQSQFIIGYVGSVVAYEGLDDLLTAFSHVIKQAQGAKLLIVGDGDAMPSLRSQTKALGLEADVVFAGKVKPADVSRYFSLLDVVALPRKPIKVCQLVSPLKPLEAMAMGVPLVVSDVAALKEMVQEDETALVHKSGDASSLAQCLLRLANDRRLAERLAHAARHGALATRTWQTVAAQMSRSYSAISAQCRQADKPYCSCRKSPAILARSAQRCADTKVPAGRTTMTVEEKALFDEKLVSAVKAGGMTALQKLLIRQLEGRSSKFAAYCQLKAANVALNNGFEADATKLADIALKNDPGAVTVRGAAWVFYNAALLKESNELVNRLECMQEIIGDGDRKFIDEVRGRAQLNAWAAERPAPRTLPVAKGRVLNVVAFSLPYATVGYATRSHGLAMGIRNAGWDIRPYTRPGFPFDFKPELEGQTLPEHDQIDGIHYRRIFGTKRRGTNEVQYLLAAIGHLERIIEQEQPEVVHAASNYVTALPALIAARRLSVPFVYEIRGFWEVTRSSRDEAFENTPKYRFMQFFEGLVAQQADQVITITTSMKEELIERGVPEGKISVAYNSVNPSRFVPSAPNKPLAERLCIPSGVPVIGYVGSFVDYEGLDDLITAAAGLEQAGHDFRLLLVGDGAALESLREQVHSLGLIDKTILTGRVPFEEVGHYYSLIDIAPFPRKPWKVCEMVSPLKPFEAMALEKSVVVSSTRALTEIVEHGRNGLVFEKGKVNSLRDVLEELIIRPEQRQELGKAARQWITLNRSWDVAGNICGRAYSKAILNGKEH